jgi:hypothetical protein
MRADFGSIQMLDTDRHELRLIAWRNFHPESARVWQSVSRRVGSHIRVQRAGARRAAHEALSAEFQRYWQLASASKRLVAEARRITTSNFPDGAEYPPRSETAPGSANPSGRE